MYSFADDGVDNSYEDISEEDLRSGRLAYLLNNSSNDIIEWRQNLGIDEYPTFYGDVVYCVYPEGDCHNKIYSNEKLYSEPQHVINNEYEVDGDNHFHKCVNCDYKTDVEAHIFNENWQYADGDAHASKCSACGILIRRGHNWGNRTVVKESTIDVPGECTYTCMDCNCTRKTELLIDAKGPEGQIQMDTTFLSGLLTGNKKKVTITANDSQTGMDKENRVVYSQISEGNNIYEGKSEVYQ